MMDKIKITDDFKKTLSSLSCCTYDDFIIITRTEGDKVFFKYGKCKLHLTKDELEKIKQKESGY